MRTKSKYRVQSFKDGGRVEQLSATDEELNQETPIEGENNNSAPAIDSLAPTPDETPTIAVAISDEPLDIQNPTPSEPEAGLIGQLAALKRSEELQRERNGIEARRQEWLKRSPGAQQNMAALNVLHRAAIDAGLTDASPQYFSFMESQLAALSNQVPAPNGERPQQQSTPTFFQPPMPRMPAEHRSSIVSAPVSREVPNGGPRIESNPSKVDLSPQELQIARASGISATKYAEGKLLLEREKRAGIRQ